VQVIQVKPRVLVPQRIDRLPLLCAPDSQEKIKYLFIL
jgi:hypothetical protein